jgi:hypothetical protein
MRIAIASTAADGVAQALAAGLRRVPASDLPLLPTIDALGPRPEAIRAGLPAVHLAAVPVCPVQASVDAAAAAAALAAAAGRPAVFAVVACGSGIAAAIDLLILLARYGAVATTALPHAPRQGSDPAELPHLLACLCAQAQRLYASASSQAPREDGERRRDPRVAWAAAARVRQGRRVWDCRVLDISGGGIALTCLPSLPRGAEVEVGLPGLDSVRAEVRYSLEERTGLRFLEPPERRLRWAAPAPAPSPAPSSAHDAAEPRRTG